MDEQQLWENFKKTGRIADYLRYRGVDIYAATNSVRGKEPPDADSEGTGDGSRHRGTHHPRI